MAEAKKPRKTPKAAAAAGKAGAAAKTKKSDAAGKTAAPRKTAVRKAVQRRKTPPVAAAPSGAGGTQWLTNVVLAYVALVLLVDTLTAKGVGTPFNFTIFHWRMGALYDLARHVGLPVGLVGWLQSGLLQHFDLFKFTFWLLIPFFFALWRMDWGVFGYKRWSQIDLLLLSILAVLGMAAVLLVPHIRALGTTYHGLSHLPGKKVTFFLVQFFWIVSWLPGWEFMHRYVLLRRAAISWPRFGWLLVPISEGLYHLQKPALEALGMVALSVVLTQWALRRKNILLPFLVHFIIEIELAAFLLFV